MVFDGDLATFVEAFADLCLPGSVLALLAVLDDGSSVELEAVEGMIHSLLLCVFDMLHSLLLHFGGLLLHFDWHVKREQVGGLLDRPVIDIVHLDLAVPPG